MSARALKISDEVAAVLERVSCTAGVLSLEPIGQMDRKLYMAVDKVLREAGGKWEPKWRWHRFPHGCDALDIVDRLLLTREVTSVKRLYQQYDTAPEIAARLIEVAGVAKGHRVLEPSMGLGVLAFAAIRLEATVTGYEIDPARHGLVTHNMQRRKLGQFFDGCVLGNFMLATPTPIFDRVVMNPPFTRSQDVNHVMRAMDFLKPGGRLAAIVSRSALSRHTPLYVDFQDRVDSWEDIPAGSFKDSGTLVETSLISMKKGKS